VASTKEIIIPYGSCEIDKNGFLKNILEKPTLDYLINTGLYVLEPEVLKYIPVDEFFHITDLIDLLKKKGKKIGVFPIDEAAWVDVGQWAEYREAVKRLN
jgi:NDP-sugar pyrophosphorylase family protein